MKNVQGKCLFCGQYRAIEVPDTFTEEDIDEEVTKKCDCPEAKADTDKKEKIATSEAKVKEIFEGLPALETMQNMLLSALKPLTMYDIDGITIKKAGYTGKLKPGKDGLKVTLEHKTVKES